MDPFNWTCPCCGNATTITQPNTVTSAAGVTAASEYGECRVIVRSIACPNTQCRGLFLTAGLYQHATDNLGRPSIGAVIETWQLKPRSNAKPQPDFIPQEIRVNYLEACLIANDSPKASASMSRRCLQGIVRDYWRIPANKRGNLGSELSHIKDSLDPDTWEAIQAVRAVGDIGAHMEKDVNLIVDVEPSEAALLIALIETLLTDWYVARHKRQERNAALRTVVTAKLQAKRQGKSQPLGSPDQLAANAAIEEGGKRGRGGF